MRRVAKRIAEVRQERGLTQEAVALELGTATKNYQRIEYGQNVTVHMLGRLAAIFEVDPATFFEKPQGGGRAEARKTTRPQARSPAAPVKRSRMSKN